MHCFDINEELIVLERMDDEEDDYDLWDYETDPEDEVPDDHLLDHTLPDPAESDRLNVICIQADEVVNEMNREIEKAKNVIERSYTSTRLLLSAYDWDAQKCIDHYFAEQSKGGNDLESSQDMNFSFNNKTPLFGIEVAQSPQDSFLFNLSPDSIHSPFQPPPTSKVIQPRLRCLICFDDVEVTPPKSRKCSSPTHSQFGSPMWSSIVLRIRGCRHIFCKTCLIQYLESKIVDFGKIDRIYCPEDGCENVVDDEVIMSLLKSAANVKAVSRYMQLMANGYIQKNRLMRWCPSPECSFALRAEQNLMKRVECRCGKVICFKCGKDWHDPIQCTLLDKWLLKYTTDCENAHYIVANTKPCPNESCKVSIEKNGGCNHMVCKSCQNHFCWICLEAWEKHGQNWYNCTRYKEGNDAVARNLEASRERLRRFVHYGGRYDLHTSSLRKVPELREAIKAKVTSMTNDCRLSYVDTKFLEPAVDVLVECRKVLAYTYAFAYYLATNNQKSILEDNQKDLELVTEDLTAALERDLGEHPFSDVNDVSEYKQKVQNHTSYCEKRAKKLLEHVKEGYESQLWEYDASFVDEKVLSK